MELKKELVEYEAAQDIWEEELRKMAEFDPDQLFRWVETCPSPLHVRLWGASDWLDRSDEVKKNQKIAQVVWTVVEQLGGRETDLLYTVRVDGQDHEITGRIVADGSLLNNWNKTYFTLDRTTEGMRSITFAITDIVYIQTPRS